MLEIETEHTAYEPDPNDVAEVVDDDGDLTLETTGFATEADAVKKILNSLPEHTHQPATYHNRMLQIGTSGAAKVETTT